MARRINSIFPQNQTTKMRIFGIFLLVLVILFSVISGCVNTNTVKELTPTPTSLTQAVEFHKIGFTAYIDGNYEKALEYFNKSLDVDPKFARAWMDKGNVLTRMNRSAEAIAAYDAALALDTNIPQVWNSRGEALMSLGRYAEALESFEKVLAINPDNSKAKENRERVLAKLN